MSFVMPVGTEKPISYVDEESGIVVQALSTVNREMLLDVMVRPWPAPVPLVMITPQPTHWFVAQVLLVLLRKLAPFPPVEVPLSPLLMRVWLPVFGSTRIMLWTAPDESPRLQT